MKNTTDQARERILAKAEEKFRKFGVRRVTMDQIAGEIRMSKKTLYRHFSGKQELVRQLALRIVGARLEDMRQALVGASSPREAFAAGFIALQRLAREAAPVFLADVRADYPEIWDELEAERSQVLHIYAERIAEGTRAGDIRPGIVPEVAAGIMQVVVQNYMIPERFRDENITPREAVTTWFTLLSAGLFKDPPVLVVEPDEELFVQVNNA